MKDADGQELFEAHESSLVVALVRRIADIGIDWLSLLSWLPFNFTLRRNGHEADAAVLGKFRDRYVLDLGEGLSTPIVGSCSFAVALDALHEPLGDAPVADAPFEDLDAVPLRFVGDSPDRPGTVPLGKELRPALFLLARAAVEPGHEVARASAFNVSSTSASDSKRCRRSVRCLLADRLRPAQHQHREHGDLRRRSRRAPRRTGAGT